MTDPSDEALVPRAQIPEQDRPQLDEPQCRLASGDDGVHTGTVRVVGTDATIAIAVEGGGVTATPAVSFTGDEIDECDVVDLLHDSLSASTDRTGAERVDNRLVVVWGHGPKRRCSPEYTNAVVTRQEGK